MSSPALTSAPARRRTAAGAAAGGSAAAASAARRRERPQLAVVPGATGRPLGPFVAVLCLVLGGGLMGLLLLNTLLAEDAYRLHDLERQSAELHDRQEALTREVDTLADPAHLAARAHALGMVGDTDPRFVSTQGKVLGATATGLPRPGARQAREANGGVVVVSPRTHASATPRARPSGHASAKASAKSSAKGSHQASAGPSGKRSGKPSSGPSSKPSSKPSSSPAPRPSSEGGR